MHLTLQNCCLTGKLVGGRCRHEAELTAALPGERPSLPLDLTMATAVTYWLHVNRQYNGSITDVNGLSACRVSFSGLA